MALQSRDVDLEKAFLRIRDGKAKREDLIPLHPQLAEVLGDRKQKDAKALDRVFPTVVTDLTRGKDFLAAGLARVEEAQQEDGTMKRKIVTEDEEGRVIDLHAMRTTLGTALARQGVAPQIAQQIMRHRDYRTTLKHYTSLSLSDAAKGMAEVPPVLECHPETVPQPCPQFYPHSGHDLVRFSATQCENAPDGGGPKQGCAQDVTPENRLPCSESPAQYNASGRVTQLARVPPLQGGSSRFESEHAHSLYHC